MREDLRRRMAAAAEAMDFEEAGRLRDRLSLLADADAEPDAVIDTSRMTRQQPGRMGLGTSEPGRVRPAGWTPPPRPDPMTRTVKGRTHKR